MRLGSAPSCIWDWQRIPHLQPRPHSTGFCCNSRQKLLLLSELELLLCGLVPLLHVQRTCALAIVEPENVIGELSIYMCLRVLVVLQKERIYQNSKFPCSRRRGLRSHYTKLQVGAWPRSVDRREDRRISTLIRNSDSV